MKRSYFELRQNYSDAIYAAGGCPVLIPLIPEPAYIESLVDRLDGICLSGSPSDMDPLRYGQEPHPKLGEVLPRRDETDLLLLLAAERRKIPLLAICFGIQALNVSRGGTLVQDIGSQVEGSIKHQQSGEQTYHSHTVRLASGSILDEIAGPSLRVNSHHHQAIQNAGRDLTPIAWASDGLIEAVHDPRPDYFVLGVQWHPEVGWESDPASSAIFERFIAAAQTQKSGASVA